MNEQRHHGRSSGIAGFSALHHRRALALCALAGIETATPAAANIPMASFLIATSIRLPPRTETLQSVCRSTILFHETVRTSAKSLNLFLIQGTFTWPTRFLSMSERASTKLIGLSLAGIFLAMLMLNAITP